MGAADAITAVCVQKAEVRRVEREGAWVLAPVALGDPTATCRGSNGGGWEEGSGLVEGTERDGDAGIACKPHLVSATRPPATRKPLDACVDVVEDSSTRICHVS